MWRGGQFEVLVVVYEGLPFADTRRALHSRVFSSTWTHITKSRSIRRRFIVITGHVYSCARVQ